MVKAIGSKEDMQDVIISFDDGVWAIFKPYRHGLGYQVEGLRNLYLMSKDNTPIFTLNSRLYRNGPQDDEYGIVDIDVSLTQQKVAEYWEEAKRYIIEKFFPNKEDHSVSDDSYWYSWVVVSKEGQFDLIRLSKGEMKLIH